MAQLYDPLSHTGWREILLVSSLALLPLLILAFANDQWLYSSIGSVDAWMYIAYGMHWTDPSYADWYYKSSRLPWILANVVGQKLLGTTFTTPVLQFICFAILAIFTFALVKRLFGAYTGVIAAIIAVTWTQHHGPVEGPDYHNSLCGPLFAVAAYLTVRFVQENRSPIWFSAPGAIYGALLHTNPLYLNLAVTFLVLGYVGAQHKGVDAKIKYLLAAFACAIFGGLMATVVLGAINFAFGRQFLFFVVQLQYSANMLAGGQRWWKPWEE